MYNHLTS